MNKYITCPRCDGRGYTNKESPVVKGNKVIHPGSGCTKCLGVARIKVAA